MTIEELRALLLSYRYSFHSELRLQNAIEHILKKANAEFIREYQLNKRERPDFYFPNTRLCLEVKIGGGITGHLRQMKRYADHPDVAGVVLVQQRQDDVPPLLSGKPCACIGLWRNLL